MKLKDLNQKQSHFIGVGGIGMSGIAQLLASKGFKVSGSDLSENNNTERLRAHGVQVTTGHDPSTLEGKDLIIISTDIKECNPELMEARLRNLPIIHRSEMLALLMESSESIAISGTHGKTSTTALMGWTFEQAGADPTTINGGVMNACESNIKIGRSPWFIVEADESDGSFLKIPRKYAVVANIDPEHMDYYQDESRLYSSFETFLSELNQGGAAVLGIDHPKVFELWQKIKSTQRCITFGVHPEADVRAEDIQFSENGSQFDLVNSEGCFKVSLSLYGHHNIINSLAVAAVAFECGIRPNCLQEAFQTFKGVQRRFTKVGEWKGVTIIDDYAHHPVEISATLKAARNAVSGRVIAVLEPHRYSRLEHHFQEFTKCCEEADVTIVLPVYAAREISKKGLNHEDLVKAMRGEVYTCDDPKELPQLIQKIARAGDMVICLGAGTITSFARALPKQLNQLTIKMCA